MVSSSDVVKTGAEVVEKSVKVAEAGAEAVQTAQSYFYTAAQAIAILLVGFIIGILLRKLTKRIAEELHINKWGFKLGWDVDFESGLSTLILIITYVITWRAFLDQLGITSLVMLIGGVAILFLLLLMVIVGIKDLIPNLRGRVHLRKLVRGQVLEVHPVESCSVLGKVLKVGWFETALQTKCGDILYMPNALLRKDKNI